MFQENHVRMFPEPVVNLFQVRSVEMFPEKSAGMLIGKSAIAPQLNNAKKCQDKDVQVNLKDNAKVFQENLAEPSPENPASQFPSNSAVQHLKKFAKTSLRENAKKLAKMCTGVKFATPTVMDIDHPEHRIPRIMSRKTLNRQTE